VLSWWLKTLRHSMVNCRSGAVPVVAVRTEALASTTRSSAKANSALV
jgi:hypothetical protein